MRYFGKVFVKTKIPTEISHFYKGFLIRIFYPNSLINIKFHDFTGRKVTISQSIIQILILFIVYY